MKAYVATIQQTRWIAQNTFDFVLQSKPLAAACRPGQFLMIDCGPNLLLKRPISVCDAEGDTVRIIFQVRGEGTRQLACKKKGDSVSLFGPLGTGFSDCSESRVLCIGGGIGTYPLLFAAKSAKNADAVLGFANINLVTTEEDFKDCCGHLSVCTDDGSYGHAGLVTARAAELLAQNRYDKVLACGPKGMLKAVQQLCAQHGLPSELSMEERMGCGVGACLTCVSKTKKDGQPHHPSVCKEAPVFTGSELVFDA